MLIGNVIKNVHVWRRFPICHMIRILDRAGNIDVAFGRGNHQSRLECCEVNVSPVTRCYSRQRWPHLE
jgi:hypothetical protein